MIQVKNLPFYLELIIRSEKFNKGKWLEHEKLSMNVGCLQTYKWSFLELVRRVHNKEEKEIPQSETVPK